MTFKHVKFEDSPTMRALEKVAKEKGLVKPEPLQKKASITKKADYTPSADLMENVLKLCSGLRAQGLVKEAAELETNYLNYKQAQTLYETSKETGEDVLQFAHPKGSHKLENVEGDEAVVEDLLEKHLKHVQMVEKKPTGKLSTAQAISSVKMALGQITAPKESESELNAALYDRINKLLPTVAATVKSLKNFGGEDYDAETADAALQQMRDGLASRPFDRKAFRTVMAGYSKLQGTAKSGLYKTHEWFGSPDSDDPGLAAWNRPEVGGQMGVLGNSLRSLESFVTKLENIQSLKDQGTYQDPGDAAKKNVITIPEVTLESDPLVTKLQGLIGRLNSFKGVLSISRDPQATKWIDEEIKEISAAQDRIDDVAEKEPAQRKNMDARYQRDVATFEQEVNQFQKDWVDA